MKLNKLFLLAALAVAGLFTSCSDDDNYSAGDPAGSYNVGFPDQENLILSSTATSFEVTVSRTSGSGALTVPIEVYQCPDYFTVPESVTFADGQTETTVVVTIADGMPFNTNVDFEIRIPEEYTNAYLDQELYPIYKISLNKEDYETKYTATFYDNFWYGETWDVTLEYSPSLNIWRIKDMYADGYHYYMQWDGDTSTSSNIVFTDETGAQLSKCETGIVSSTYGMISSTQNETSMAYSYYDADEAMFQFYFKFTVSAGSFGFYPGYIYNLQAVD